MSRSAAKSLTASEELQEFKSALEESRKFVAWLQGERNDAGKMYDDLLDDYRRLSRRIKDTDRQPLNAPYRHALLSGLALPITS